MDMYDDDTGDDFDAKNVPFHIKVQFSVAVIEVLHQWHLEYG
jgi:hypothetical protein